MQRGPKVAVALDASSGGVKVTLNCVPQLILRLQRKELEAKSIARYPAEILWPEGPKSAMMFKLREKDMIMEGARAKEQDYEGLFKCGKCKSTKTTYYQMQTRSADEPSAFCNSFEFEIMFPTDASLYSDHLRDLQIVFKPLEVLKFLCCVILQMPRGRPAVPKAPTKFLNKKRRVIYMTANGKYLAKSEKGAAVYAPKAAYVKSPGGTERTLVNSGARVPTAIRPKATRKTRSDKGAMRRKPGQVHRTAMGPKRPVGRPRKARANPLGNMGLARLFGGKPVRKARANAGVKRGPRVGRTLLGKNPFNLLR